MTKITKYVALMLMIAGVTNIHGMSRLRNAFSSGLQRFASVVKKNVQPKPESLYKPGIFLKNSESEHQIRVAYRYVCPANSLAQQRLVLFAEYAPEIAYYLEKEALGHEKEASFTKIERGQDLTDTQSFDKTSAKCKHLFVELLFGDLNPNKIFEHSDYGLGAKITNDESSLLGAKITKEESPLLGFPFNHFGGGIGHPFFYGKPKYTINIKTNKDQTAADIDVHVTTNGEHKQRFQLLKERAAQLTACLSIKPQQHISPELGNDLLLRFYGKYSEKDRKALKRQVSFDAQSENSTK